MNWKYRVDDEDLILSEEENRQVLELQERGEKGIVILRNGDLRLNLSFIRYVKPTENLTGMQENEKLSFLPLAKRSMETYQERRSKLQGFIRVSHDDFYNRMGWEHFPTCACKNTKKD